MNSIYGYLSGFVAVIGSPNVGKSTLTNAMVGQKVSIVSDRAQTTRNRVMGVVTRDGWQMVLLDTPGVTTPKNRLGEYMLKSVCDAMDEVEAILFMVDAKTGVREKDEALITRLASAHAPVIAAINKVDIASMADVDDALDKLSKAEFIKQTLKISATTGQGMDKLEQTLKAYLVPGPQYFPEDMVTDQPERVICSELIREKALRLLRQEVPHGLGVGVDKMSTREDGVCEIWATIFCERASHKGMIIGKQGAMLKRIGIDARNDIEWMLGQRVNLQLWVKVREDWRNSVAAMRELGYDDKQ